MDIFGHKAREEVEKAKLELQLAQMRLRGYAELMRKLAKHDYCKIGEGGGAVGYDKRDEHLPEVMRGTMYMTPDEKMQVAWYRA